MQITTTTSSVWSNLASCEREETDKALKVAESAALSLFSVALVCFCTSLGEDGLIKGDRYGTSLNSCKMMRKPEQWLRVKQQRVENLFAGTKRILSSETSP